MKHPDRVEDYLDHTEIIWTTVKRDLPQLKQQIDTLLLEHLEAQEQRQEFDRGM